MRLRRLLATATILALDIAQAATTFSPARAPAFPLAVRSPYLSTWLMGDSGGYLPGNWPRFWAGQITGMTGFVSVDDQVYTWMGAPANSPALVTQTSVSYTSTKTVYNFDVDGKVSLTATFLSPVWPEDIVRQSLQFSYIRVDAAATDGADHNVTVYMDVSGEFTSADHTAPIQWSSSAVGDVRYHAFELENPVEFAENNEQATWGTWYLATTNDDGTTWKSGADSTVRGQFVSNHGLDDTADTNFRAINNNWPVFGLSHNLGSVSSTATGVTFALGVAMDHVINFLGNTTDPIGLDGVWKRSYLSQVDSLIGFYDDYENAVLQSTSLDTKVQTDSVAAGGQDYATITSLAVRQAFAGLTPASGPTQDYLFLKEISSDGDIQTVDVVFPAHPILLYFNPSWIKLLLDPLFENQESGHWPQSYTIHDLGNFPNALGHLDGNNEAMPLEESGNMIIMALAYAQRTGDDGYLDKHYGLLNQWAGYLVNESLIPADQLSTDDFAGTLANQTNLALKGIIALKAMDQVATRAGRVSTFGATADGYLKQWQTLGINSAASPPHSTLQYNNPNSWNMLYNLFADRELNLNFVPQDIYDMQSTYYPTVMNKYGVPLDSRHTWAKSDWEMFAAAISSPSTRDLITASLVKWINETPITTPFGDLFDTVDGGYGTNAFKARPVVGGMFAMLIL